MTPRYIFTVHTLHKKKIEDAFDKWEKRGLSKSRKICEAIVKLHDEEEKGTKITAFNGQQSKLPMLPPVYEIPTKQDLEGLTYDERRTIFFTAQEWVRIVRLSLEKDQIQR